LPRSDAMRNGVVHVIGAGLAGLSAAVTLAARGTKVEISEASAFAGGRCRSYFDPQLEQIIDNGNHLILSGNHSVHEYLRRIGAERNFIGPGRAEFAFADLQSGEGWTIRPNEGRLPWWILLGRRRVPGTHASDYFRLLELTHAVKGKSLGVSGHRGPLWEKLLHPFLLAALNTEPETASAELIANVMRESLMKGGRAYHPQIAFPTLAAAFVLPAIAFISARDAALHFNQRLQRLIFEGGGVVGLEFPHGVVPVDEEDSIVLAVPAPVAASIILGVSVPDQFRAIVSAHFGIAPPPGRPPMTGVLGGTVEWIFCFPDRVSVTISNADRLVEQDRAELAQRLWSETATVLGLPPELPRWQVVKEKRATFAATPEQEAKRPGPTTPYRNLFLAGDWTATGLPATIEGAVRSGKRAAELALARAHV
jgi:squalene-associated FAD-dependent desaturase